MWPGPLQLHQPRCLSYYSGNIRPGRDHRTDATYGDMFFDVGCGKHQASLRVASMSSYRLAGRWGEHRRYIGRARLSD